MLVPGNGANKILVIAVCFRGGFPIFQQLFKDASLGTNGNITLARTDGTLLMRWPYQETMLGRNLKSAKLYSHLAKARSGRFETEALTDGVHRLVIYSQIGDLPIVVGVGQSTDDIYAPWYVYAFAIGSLMLLLCGMSVGLACYLVREMRRRDAAETALALLATTDGLTGLSNGRRFNEAIDREWHRALRERKRLALIMIDADLFKNYNDLHGHQAGDKLLQAVGAAMRQNIGRGTDVTARYGGDEFAVLLPGASADDASQIADNIRGRLTEVCGRQQIACSTISIGVASVVPRAGESQNTLVAEADQAAYRAKQMGRDRIQIAPPRIYKPILAIQSTAA